MLEIHAASSGLRNSIYRNICIENHATYQYHMYYFRTLFYLKQVLNCQFLRIQKNCQKIASLVY